MTVLSNDWKFAEAEEGADGPMDILPIVNKIGSEGGAKRPAEPKSHCPCRNPAAHAEHLPPKNGPFGPAGIIPGRYFKAVRRPRIILRQPGFILGRYFKAVRRPGIIPGQPTGTAGRDTEIPGRPMIPPTPASGTAQRPGNPGNRDIRAAGVAFGAARPRIECAGQRCNRKYGDGGRISLAAAGRRRSFPMIGNIFCTEQRGRFINRQIIERSPMKKLLMSLVVFSVLLAARGQDASPNPYANETKEERDARMKWWREARFGMFIHWGVYSVPAGFYKGKPVGGIGEWIMCSGKIPIAEYRQFAPQFNPVKFDAEKWVKIAKDAGQKYIVITSKHHDGFAMFDSKVTNWCITGATPFKRDPLKELAEACRKEGIKLGFYYSQAQDWNNGGSECSGAWDPAQKRSMDEYIDKVAVPQMKEILSNYGEFPAVLWWDTSCDMNKERADKLIALLKLKPGIIHNNRLGGGYKGDTETPEQHIPAMGYKDRDWETCMTLNNTWGFKSDDNNWKPVETLLRNLIDIASKGGNYLLNVGPTSEGEIPEASVERLHEVGKWMKVNGDAIYSTTASPFRSLPWGRCTKKLHDGGATLYLHVFTWPTDGKLIVPGLKSEVVSAKLLASGEKLKTELSDGVVTISVPAQAPDAIASVVVLETKGELQVESIAPQIAQAADGSVKFAADAADIIAPDGVEAPQVENKGGAPNIGFWLNPRASVEWTFKIDKPGTFDVCVATATTAKDSHIDIIVGDQKVNLVVADTGAYEKFETTKAGTIKIDKAGVCKLAVKPVADGWQPINLRSVTLAPAK